MSSFHFGREDCSSWRRFPINGRAFDTDYALHSRSFSRDSNFSMSSIEESVQETETPTSTSSISDRPSLSHLQLSPSRSASPSSTRTPESYLPSPEESVDEEFTAVSNIIRQQQQHARSLFTGGGRSASRADLSEKKSMPDLRTAKINFARKAADNQERGPPGRRTLSKLNKSLEDFTMPSPRSLQGSTSSDEPALTHPVKPFTREPVSESPTSLSQPAPSMDIERNSYFRRFSALTSTTISTAIPEPLLHLIDAARSILFAVSQVYQTLRHYTVFVIDDRLSSVLRKVLDPASADMMQLINSLDRFDSVSRKFLPPPVVCRSVVESCKDTVAVFGKAVGVLSLQLKVLASRDDVRYLRQMLLILYGATAEISFAWQCMVPHIEAVKPLLHEKRRPLLVKPHQSHSPPRAQVISSDSTHAPTLNGSSSLHPISRPSLPRTHSDDTIGGLSLGRTHTARRHAGSFSSKDVEIGRVLPSYEEVPFISSGLAGGIAARTPALRITKRQMTLPNPSLPSPSLNAPGSNRSPSPWSSATGYARAGKFPSAIHSRQGSQASLQTLASSSSPSIPTKPSQIEIPLNSRSLVDKEALDAMKVAVEAAPAVWEMMNEILADFLETNVEVRETLALAKIVTRRLRDNILAMQQGDAAADKRNLREDAHLFVKVLICVLTFFRSHDTDIYNALRRSYNYPTSSKPMVPLTLFHQHCAAGWSRLQIPPRSLSYFFMCHRSRPRQLLGHIRPCPAHLCRIQALLILRGDRKTLG
jgi:hypothetical protein